QDGPNSGLNEVLSQSTLVGSRDRDIGYLHWLQRDGCPPKYSFPLAKLCGAPSFREGSAGFRRHPLDKLLGRLVVLEHHSAVKAGQLDGAGNHCRQYRLQIKRRTDRSPDLPEGCELVHRSRELARPRL